MKEIELKQKEIIFNAIKEISKLESYKKYKSGDIVKIKFCSNKEEYGLYLFPSVTCMNYFVYVPLNKSLSLRKNMVTYIEKACIDNVVEIIGFNKINLNKELNFQITIKDKKICISGIS